MGEQNQFVQKKLSTQSLKSQGFVICSARVILQTVKGREDIVFVTPGRGGFIAAFGD